MLTLTVDLTVDELRYRGQPILLLDAIAAADQTRIP
jgi:hypothetical protein